MHIQRNLNIVFWKGPFKTNIKSRKLKIFVGVEIKYLKLILYYIKNVV